MSLKTLIVFAFIAEAWPEHVESVSSCPRGWPSREVFSQSQWVPTQPYGVCPGRVGQSWADSSHSGKGLKVSPASSISGHVNTLSGNVLQATVLAATPEAGPICFSNYPVQVWSECLYKRSSVTSHSSCPLSWGCSSSWSWWESCTNSHMVGGGGGGEPGNISVGSTARDKKSSL